MKRFVLFLVACLLLLVFSIETSAQQCGAVRSSQSQSAVVQPQVSVLQLPAAGPQISTSQSQALSTAEQLPPPPVSTFGFPGQLAAPQQFAAPIQQQAAPCSTCQQTAQFVPQAQFFAQQAPTMLFTTVAPQQVAMFSQGGGGASAAAAAGSASAAASAAPSFAPAAAFIQPASLTTFTVPTAVCATSACSQGRGIGILGRIFDGRGRGATTTTVQRQTTRTRTRGI